MLTAMVALQGQDSLGLKLQDPILSWRVFARFNYQFSLALS